MERAQALAQRFEEVMLNGTWVANTNYLNTIQDVTFTEAVHTIPPWNTIYALTFHMHYYIRGVLDVFEGGELTIRDQFSFQLSEEPSPDSWEKLKSQLIDDSRSFAIFVAAMKDDDLASVFVKKDYGNMERNIDGMIEHAYYHLGQISLIKKYLRTQSAAI